MNNSLGVFATGTKSYAKAAVLCTFDDAGASFRQLSLFYTIAISVTVQFRVILNVSLSLLYLSPINLICWLCEGGDSKSCLLYEPR